MKVIASARGAALVRKFDAAYLAAPSISKPFMIATSTLELPMPLAYVTLSDAKVTRVRQNRRARVLTP